MPLQQIQLDQSIYRKDKQGWGASRQPSPYSQALTPRKDSGMTAEQRYAPGFVDRQKEEWAMEDKLKKEERDARVKEAQEMGMRIRAAAEAEKEKGRQMSAEVEAQKATLPGMAKALWDFAKDLDEEGQATILASARAKPGMMEALRETGLLTRDNKFVKLAGEPIEHAWNIQEGFLVDKTTGTFYEMPEKEADRFDPSKIQELYDSKGNTYFMYNGKALTPSDKAPDIPEMGEKTGKVITAATKIADGVAMKGTPQWEEAFKNAMTSVGEAMGLSAEETLAASKLSDVKYGQAAALAMQFKDADYTPGMMTEEFKEQILKANPTLTAQTLNVAIDNFTNNYVPSPSTTTTTVEEMEEEKTERKLSPKVEKVTTGISDAIKAITGTK